MSQVMRYATADERAIATRLVEVLLAYGYEIRVHEGEDWAGERSSDKLTILKALCSTGQDTLYVYDPAAPANACLIGWVLLIWGNGRDLISDSCSTLESILVPVGEYADSLA